MIKQRSLLRGVMAWGLILCFSAVFSSCNQRSTKPTSSDKPELSGVYYLIRHAEKDRSNSSNKDPELIQKGLERSQRWAQYFDSIPLSGVYSTAYRRTLQTALPTATNKALSPIIYQANALLDDSFYVNAQSGHWLIVGHSDTTPYWANALLKTDSLSDIPDSINSRVYRIDLRFESPQFTISNIE